ncbi:MAG: hypothetical protein Q4F67_06695 [Propionibacteriaceae bacterium]|nr:hypothetical protein [Propionibacteriaceae bacterium]
MTMPERGQEDYDRDFTAMVSGLEMDGISPGVTPPSPNEPPDLREQHATWSPDAFETFNLTEAIDEVEPDDPDPSEYTPPPLPPMRRPKGLAAVAAVCGGYVLAAMLLTIVGVRLPGWAGWLAVIAFVATVILGWRALPRHRDPWDGDGAVV